MDLHGIFLCIAISQKYSFLNAQAIHELKREKCLKVFGALDWEISSTFLENTLPFSIGTGAEIRPQKQPWKIPVHNQST